MKLWVSSGVFVAAGALLSSSFLRGQGLAGCRQTRCCTCRRRGNRGCAPQRPRGPVVNDFSLNLKLMSTLEVRLTFFPGSRLSQVLAGVQLRTQRQESEAKLKMLLPKLSVLKF